ncbi:hypothetical protein K8T06_06160, partial [bacterium]|nr:hypothetical protein [bacterium]
MEIFANQRLSTLCILVFLLIIIPAHLYAAGTITVLAADSTESGTINIRTFQEGEYISLTQWAQNVDASLEWDYVTGVAEMRFRDHRIRWVDTGRGAWVNGRMHSMPGPARQEEGDIWIPVKLLDDLVDPLWEGDLTWDAERQILRRFIGRAGVASHSYGNDDV